MKKHTLLSLCLLSSSLLFCAAGEDDRRLLDSTKDIEMGNIMSETDSRTRTGGPVLTEITLEQLVDQQRERRADARKRWRVNDEEDVKEFKEIQHKACKSTTVWCGAVWCAGIITAGAFAIWAKHDADYIHNVTRPLLITPFCSCIAPLANGAEVKNAADELRLRKSRRARLYRQYLQKLDQQEADEQHALQQREMSHKK